MSDLNNDLKTDPTGRAQQAVEFGAAMRDMRLAHKRELSDVANSLRIRQVYLKAIEEGRFDDLPGPTYAVGFVRAYADYLGLELDEVMRRYRGVTGDQPAQGPLVPPTPVVEARLPTGFILLVAIILAVAAYGGWYYLTIHGKDTGEVISQIPARIAEMVGLTTPENEKPGTAETPSSASPDKAAGDVAEKTGGAGVPMASPDGGTGDYRPPANGDQATGSVPPDTAAPSNETSVDPSPQAASETATDPNGAGSGDAASTVPPVNGPVAPDVDNTGMAPTPASMPGTPPVAAPSPAPSEMTDAPIAPADSPTAPAETLPSQSEPTPIPPASAPQIATAPAANATTESRVVLRANEMSWVELRDSAGNRLISRLLEAGETYKVPARQGIMMVTGNAGGIDILVDGKAIMPIGPTGAVRRDILLEAEALLAR